MSTDLPKLTVPQLKALCKEKGLSGYSKLAKSALVEKLVAAGCCVQSAVPSSSVTNVPPEQLAVQNSARKKPAKPSHAPLQSNTSATNPPPEQSNGTKTKPPKPIPAPARTVENGKQPGFSSDTPKKQTAVNGGKEKPTSASQPQVEVSTSTQSAQRQQGAHNQVVSSGLVRQVTTTATVQAVPSKDAAGGHRARTSPPLQLTSKTGEPPAKKQKLSHIQDRQTIAVRKEPQNEVPRVQKRPNALSRPIPVVIRPVQPVDNEEGQEKTHSSHIPRGTTGAAGKRYIPLVIKSQKNVVPVGPVQQSAPSSLLHHAPSPDENLHPSGLFSFPPLLGPEKEFKPSFKAITLPPPLSQRKYATNLAIILRDVAFEDLPNLTLTSKLFRYSAYLSAVGYLRRWFFGERLDRVLNENGISVDRMSLWEYRRVREREVGERKRVLSVGSENGSGGVLGRLVSGDVGVVEEGLWRRDDTRGLVVALRFVLTRCYFLVSLNRDLKGAKRDRVVDVQEIVKGEIWCITVERRNENRQLTKFYVLEATCEIIGSPVELGGTVPTRTDWSGHIKKHVLNHGAAQTMGIMDHIRWTNGEEYDHGISKIWLKRTQEEGGIGELKRRIARRYILACTMENSLSGRYMTSNEMEQELNGLPSKVAGFSSQKKVKETRINLFVPAHHHVESVHFTTAGKKPLHPALAVVQTPSREYYILKENGMQVGCEEEGLAEVWMEIIGCYATGE